MKTKPLILLFLLTRIFLLNGQSILMFFPKFAGKSYDFIIFQGDQQKTVFQGKIPEDGKFTLNVPKEYEPYTGMSRWLITGTKEGGGLDMVIPGKSFSVSCTEIQPTEKNIIYSGNDQVNELNRLYADQQKILMRYAAMQQALKSFPATDPGYPVFEKAGKEQQAAFRQFHQQISKNPDYAQKLIPIINITQGMGTELTDTEEKRARNIAAYIAGNMDWQALYTSGHWTSVISAWVDIHSQVLKDPYAFTTDFATIGNAMKDDKLYTDFAGRISYYLTQQGKDQLINMIAPLVVSSGRIKKYEGSLAAYTHGAIGTTAPDLIITRHLGSVQDHNHDTTVLKSSELAVSPYTKTLLFFYESGCGPCENLLAQLPGNYADLQKQGIRIISVSADHDEKTFTEKAKTFPWKDAHCDYEGLKGINFKNYGVAGTPTLFLIDRSGKILLRTAGLDEVLDYLKKEKVH